jgi:2-keto-4-pentenoate hydratase/2-oxohepta-3-ene-1,7-dioic acid hydratase in catechol pathway
MRFATFSHDGRTQIGEVDVDARIIRPLAAVDMMDIIRGDGPPSRSGDALPLHAVRLLAPIPRPARNIFCVGKNYHEHAKEFTKSGYEADAARNAALDAYPAVFTKPASCIVATNENVLLHPTVTSEVDYEGELAVVIGRSGTDVRRSDAMSHVWGYTIINDVTARDRQKNHKQWFLGKALDTFCPMGPWITTADAVDGADLRLRTWVNGELRQDASTADLIFDIQGLIEIISAGLTLHPGDIISTGTPAGVGIGFTPPKFLQSGDTVSITIDNLGTLTNRFG